MRSLCLLVLLVTVGGAAAIECPNGLQSVHLQFLQVVDLSAFRDDSFRAAYRRSIPDMFEQLREKFGSKTETAINIFNNKPYENYDHMWCSHVELDLGTHSVSEEINIIEPFAENRYPNYDSGKDFLNSDGVGSFTDVVFKMLISPDLAWDFNNFDAEGERVVRIISLGTDGLTFVADDEKSAHAEKPDYKYYNAAREACDLVDYPTAELLQRALDDFPKVSFAILSSRAVFQSAPEWWEQEFLNAHLGGIAPGFSLEIASDTRDAIAQVIQMVTALVCETPTLPTIPTTKQPTMPTSTDTTSTIDTFSTTDTSTTSTDMSTTSTDMSTTSTDMSTTSTDTSTTSTDTSTTSTDTSTTSTDTSTTSTDASTTSTDTSTDISATLLSTFAEVPTTLSSILTEVQKTLPTEVSTILPSAPTEEPTATLPVVISSTTEFGDDCANKLHNFIHGLVEP